MVHIGKDHEHVASMCPVRVILCVMISDDGQSRVTTMGLTTLNDHIDDFDDIRVIEGLENFDLSHSSHRNLGVSYQDSARVARVVGSKLTPSRGLCVMSFFRAIALFVAISIPFVTTLIRSAWFTVVYDRRGDSPKGPFT